VTDEEARELSYGVFPDMDREVRVLRARAEVAALVREVERESEQRLATFRLGQHTYGVSLESVFAITLVQSITPLPGVGAGLVGLIGVRGRHVTALDLETFLGTPGEGAQRRIADFGKAVTVAFADRRLAFLCEEVLAVLDLFPGDLRPLEVASEVSAVQQIGAGGVQVLDLPALFSDPRLSGTRRVRPA
jgi:chemotaxis signal transduction protein